MDEFFRTRMGQTFFEGTLPHIAKQLERIADAMEKEPKRVSDWDVMTYTNVGGRVFTAQEVSDIGIENVWPRSVRHIPSGETYTINSTK